MKRPMRILLIPSMLLLVLGAGCLGAPQACAQAGDFRPVEEVRAGGDLVVNNGTAIIHTQDAEIWLDGDDGCLAIDFSHIQAGDLVADDATEVAESFPTQQWPDNVVIRRPAG